MPRRHRHPRGGTATLGAAPGPATAVAAGDGGRGMVLIGWASDLDAKRPAAAWTSQERLAAILELCHHVRTLPHEGTACATRPDAGQPVRLARSSLETMRSCP